MDIRRFSLLMFFFLNYKFVCFFTLCLEVGGLLLYYLNKKKSC